MNDATVAAPGQQVVIHDGQRVIGCVSVVYNPNLILTWSVILVLFLADISNWDGYSVMW